MTDNPRREAALAAYMTHFVKKRFYETEAQFDVRAAREVVDAILAAADAAAPAATEMRPVASGLPNSSGVIAPVREQAATGVTAVDGIAAPHADPRREAVARWFATQCALDADKDITDGWVSRHWRDYLEEADAILAAADAAAPLPAEWQELVGRLREHRHRRMTETKEEAALRRQRERDEAADAIERLAREKGRFAEMYAREAHAKMVASETASGATARAEKAEAALEECRQHGVVLAIKSETNDHRAKQAEARDDRALSALKATREALVEMRGHLVEIASERHQTRKGTDGKTGDEWAPTYLAGKGMDALGLLDAALATIDAITGGRDDG